MKLYVASRTANRALSVTSSFNYHSIPINFGLGAWWGTLGKVKPASTIAKFDPSKKADCQYSGDYVVYAADVQVPDGIEPTRFNPIDGDAPGGSGLGSLVQFESVTNSAEMPSWYVNFNAWKFRQDWPSGNITRTGQLVDDVNNQMEEYLNEMQERMYDNQRQDVYFRCERGDLATTCKETLPYEQWSPISADHHYTYATGRQLTAEMDEQYMLEKITTGHTNVAGGIFAPFILARNFFLKNAVAKKVNDSVLRSQF